MSIDDDDRDLRIHSRIENALRFLTGPLYRLTRPDALGALLARSERAGNANIEHMIEAIVEGIDLTREDLSVRIRAVIELDEEEREERAIREACEREEAA